MIKHSYYCKKCGQIYFDYTDSYRLSKCTKCNGQVIRTGHVLLENHYNELIADNQWNDETFKHYCPLAEASALPSNQQFTPKCPTCGCTNIRRISATEKAVNIGMFGLLGNKRKYQFECLNPACKYKW